MTWIFFYVGVAMLGLAVLAYAAARLVGHARDLSREVGRAGERIADATSSLQAAAVTSGRHVGGE